MMKTLFLAFLLSGYALCSEEQETSEPEPVWKKTKYSDMQNISRLILMPDMGTRHYVYEGNSDSDYMLNTTYPFHCGAMLWQGIENDTRNAQRESKNITGQTFIENYGRWVNLKPMKDTSANVSTWMEVRDYAERNYKCEVWRYANPDTQNKTTVCELLHEYVCPNNITIYSKPGCYKKQK
uniref:Putative salivary lipocalin n=1 Tax=Ixodes ricinus TaxID=34613 RepID=A0A6B0V043_IXORI